MVRLTEMWKVSTNHKTQNAQDATNVKAGPKQMHGGSSRAVKLKNTNCTSKNMTEVCMTLEAYGMPKADIAALPWMWSGSYYSVVNSFGPTTACAIRKWMK